MSKIRTSKYTFIVRRANSGLGLFADMTIKKGDFIIEYFGKRLSRDQADRKGGKYLFEINEKIVVDGSSRKNIARYINHSCRPNCETDIVRGKIYIYARKNIKPGEELGYDYGKEYFKEYIQPKGCKCNKCSN